jgi:hypothetical protein
LDAVLIEKSSVTFRVAVVVWVVVAASVPVAWIVNVTLPALFPPATIVNAAPEGVGVSVAGFIVHGEGALVVQDRFTELAYPFTAVSVPVKVAV